MDMPSESEVPEEFTVTWRIENYLSCYQMTGEFFTSPTFTLKSLGFSKWFFILFPRGTPDYPNYMVCLLYQDIDGDEQAISNIKIDMISADGEILKWGKCERAVHARNRQDCEHLAVHMEIDELTKKIENCKEDTLIIRYCFTGNETRKRKATRCEIKTRIGVDRHSFQWNVSDFNTSNWAETQKCLFRKTSHIEITLTVPEDAFLIRIQKTEINPTEFRFVTCRVSLLDVEGVERHSEKYTHLFYTKNNISAWEFLSFITKTQLNSEECTFLKNGSFTLMFQFSISAGMQSEIFVDNKSDIISFGNVFYPVDNKSDISSLVNAFHPVDTFSYLKKDLRSMFTSKKYSDVKLRVGDDIFTAHKSILAARSPVFSAMFDQDMLESKTGIVDIPDTDAETLNSFLSFLYTGTVEKIDYEITLKLIVAADKYQVESLMEKCASFLTSGLSNENACEVLVIADMVEHKLLKESAQDYIKARARKILPSQKWLQWIEKNVRLASEILSKLSVEFWSSANEESVHKRYDISSLVSVVPTMDDTFSSLKEDLRRIFTSKKYSDVKLQVGGNIFPAHKSLLAGRSPVFSAMFDQDMLESQTGVVDIPDMDAETLNSFLSFLYTGTVDKKDYEATLKLFVAADKYQVESLMEKCASSLISDLSDGNACEVLVIADMVEHKLLKESARDYILARARKILPSQEWSQWIEKNVRLASEILSKLSVEFGSLANEESSTKSLGENVAGVSDIVEEDAIAKSTAEVPPVNENRLTDFEISFQMAVAAAKSNHDSYRRRWRKPDFAVVSDVVEEDALATSIAEIPPVYENRPTEGRTSYEMSRAAKQSNPGYRRGWRNRGGYRGYRRPKTNKNTPFRDQNRDYSENW